jgi:hypothetical protein
LIGALGLGSLLAGIPALFLDLYRMRRDGSFFEQQDYLTKLRNREIRVRLLEEEAAERRRREIDDSPFGLSAGEVRRLVLAETEDGREPALLIAPFLRDPAAAEKPTYRWAISNIWHRAGWGTYLRTFDGLIGRPLHRGDIDLLAIRQILDEIPVVLVHGAIQADRRVWPEIVTWNVIDSVPRSELGKGLSGSVRAFRISLPMIEMPAASERDAADAELEMQDTLAGLCTLTAGMLGDWFRTVQYGLTPALHKLLPDRGSKQLAAMAGAHALDIAAEYGRLNRATAHVEQAQICVEAGLNEAAIQYLDKVIALLKAPSRGGPALPIELQRRLVDVYDVLMASAEAGLDSGRKSGAGTERAVAIQDIRSRLWHRTLSGFGWDDPGPGGSQ